MRYKNFVKILTDDEWNKAVEYLKRKISKDTINELKEIKKREEKDGISLRHHGFGTYVRNLLREGGFDWGEIALDTYWSDLIEEVIK